LEWHKKAYKNIFASRKLSLIERLSCQGCMRKKKKYPQRAIIFNNPGIDKLFLIILE
jgi:hypothetical protein